MAEQREKERKESNADVKKLYWILSLVCNECNEAWAETDKKLCGKCREEKEFEAMGWNIE